MQSNRLDIHVILIKKYIYDYTHIHTHAHTQYTCPQIFTKSLKNIFVMHKSNTLTLHIGVLSNVGLNEAMRYKTSINQVKLTNVLFIYLIKNTIMHLFIYTCSGDKDLSINKI